MNWRRLPVLGLLCVTLSAGATDSTIRGGHGMVLGGAEEPDARKVFIVQLQTPAAADYHASLSRATQRQPLKPGTSRADRLQKSHPLIRDYTAKLEDEQQSVIAKAGPGVRPLYSYRYSLNGFAAEMTVSQAQKLEDDAAVKAVWEDEVRPLATTHSLEFLDLFDGDAGLRGGHNLDGDGLVIAVIDSGIAPVHPALTDSRAADRPRLCQSSWADATILGRWLCRRFDKLPDVPVFDAPADWNGTCQTGERFTTDECNNKLIGARWFIDGAEATGPIDDGEIRSALDVDGHGTHTATTAAGNRDTASIFGTLIGDLEGIAPKARIAVYKACWLRPGESRASCNTSDLASAIDAAVADGVDIINYSVGSTMREVTAPDDLALLAATRAGVFSAVAAGNEGPNLATIGSPAGAPWVMTVGAATRSGNSAQDGFEITAPPSLAGRYALREALFSARLADAGPVEGSLVLADDGDTTLPNGQDGVTSDGCQPLVNGSEVTGKVVLLQRSGCLFTDMVGNAEDAGAMAAIVYNLAGDPIVMRGEDNAAGIPAVMIGQADANLILAELDNDVEVTVTLEKSLLLTETDSGNVLASFSARGPGPLGDALKPDVVAPGVNIIAGFTPDAANAMPGENYAYLSGTSMAAPHVAGVAALLREAHPDWSPAAVKSALMTTARQNLTLPGSLATPNPFDYGAGHIDPNRALDPGIVYDVDPNDYDALLNGSLDPADFNLPSLSIARLANQRTVRRTVTNVDDESGNYTAVVEAPPGIGIAVNPDSLSIAPGQSASYDVTFTYLSGPLDLWRFGALTWESDTHTARSPVAVRPTSITAPAEVTALGGSGTLTFPVEFGYNGAYSPRVHGLNLPFIRNTNEPPGFVDNDPTKTFTRRTTNGVTEHVRIVPQNTIFARFALFDALTDGDDDLDMYIYYCGPVGDFCTRIGESGSQTSQEKFDIFRPAAGVYGIYVHGFETDEVSGGPGASYSLLSWGLGETQDQGNMTASGPTTVAAGTSGDVTIDWTGLASQTIYLGGISHNTPQGVSGFTVVTIGN